MIRNIIYENQNVKFITPVTNETKIVCISKIDPIDSGWFINGKIKIGIINIIIYISENSLFKILILEINDKTFFFLKF